MNSIPLLSSNQSSFQNSGTTIRTVQLLCREKQDQEDRSALKKSRIISVIILIAGTILLSAFVSPLVGVAFLVGALICSTGEPGGESFVQWLTQRLRDKKFEKVDRALADTQFIQYANNQGTLLNDIDAISQLHKQYLRSLVLS